MGGSESTHHIANLYHCPVKVSASPGSTYADEVTDRKVKEIGGQAKVTAGIDPVKAEMGASGSYTNEVVRSGVHSRHDDNFVWVHPGRINQVGTGRGDFITITWEEEGTTRELTKNHPLKKECGLIVRPDRSLAYTKEKTMRSSGHTDYTKQAAAIRDQVAEERRQLRTANTSEKDELIRLRELENELINKQKVDMYTSGQLQNLMEAERNKMFFAEIPEDMRELLKQDMREGHIDRNNITIESDAELPTESNEDIRKAVKEAERQKIRKQYVYMLRRK